jgi:hypothetical protein
MACKLGLMLQGKWYWIYADTASIKSTWLEALRDEKAGTRYAQFSLCLRV